MATNQNKDLEKGLIDWQRATEEERHRILRKIAFWYSEGKAQEFIARNLTNWVRKHFKSSPCYRHKKQQEGTQSQELSINRYWVKRRIDELVKQKFLTVREPDQKRFIEPLEKTLGHSDKLKGIRLEVASHPEEMLQKVLLRLETLLAEKLVPVKEDVEEPDLKLAVSGGRTLLSLAHAVAETPLPTMHSVARSKGQDVLRKRLLVCSLTSGGMRDNISALSDTVAAIMANNLGCGAKGLLGPAWFAEPKDMQNFKQLEDVRYHTEMVQEAQIILTSVGWLGDENNLMTRLLKESSPDYKDRIKYPHMSDLLYNLYDGWSGKDLPLPQEAKDRFFSVMSLKNLRDRIENKDNKPYVIVLASGWEKGYHAVLGLILGKLATEVFMDAECSAGLLKAGKDKYHG